MTNPPTLTHGQPFRPENSRGLRSVQFLVGVDSGTMALAADNCFPESIDFADVPGCRGGWVASSTGWGDGGYDCVSVISPDQPASPASIIGVEVIFISPTVDDFTHENLSVPSPTSADWESMADRTADPDAHEKFRAYEESANQVFSDAFDRLIPTLHPDRESSPKLLGHLDVTHRITVGDPCYEGPTGSVDVPAGRYDAVAWELENGRTARLGLYRQR